MSRDKRQKVDADHRLSDDPNAPDVGAEMKRDFDLTVFALEHEDHLWDQKDAIAMLRYIVGICHHEARLRPGKSQIDASTVYSTLKRLLDKWEAKRCSCCQQVFATAAFRQRNGTPHHECKDCLNNKEAHDRARERARREK